VQINDLSHLPREEVAKRLRYYVLKLWYEQYKQNFFIKDIRSDVYLKNEIIAFLEGRIDEFHGWSDIIGQITDAVVKPIRDFISSFWSSVMKPGIQALLNNFYDIWESASSYALSAYNKTIEIYSLTGDVYSLIAQGTNLYLQQLQNNLLALPDSFATLLNSTTQQLQSYVFTSFQNFVSIVETSYEGLQSTLEASWNSLVETVSGQLEAVTRGLEALPQSIAAGFNSAISYIWDLILGARQNVDQVSILINKNVVEPVWNALGWVWEWIRDMITNFITTMLNTVTVKSQQIKEGNVAAAIELISIPAVSGAAISSLVSVLGTKIVGTGIEVGEIGNFLNRLMSVETFTYSLLDPLLSTAIKSPLWQVFNKMFTPRIPEVSDAIKMYWRGLISKEELQDIIMRLGYGGKFLEAYLNFTEQIPGASDLVRFVVRECFPLEALPPAPEEFVKYMAMQGYNELWCRAYWEAHWELPSFENLREAFWRGIISEEEFRKYIIWHDYKPEPRPGISKSDVDIMYELIWRLPGKLDARWMLRWGVITKEEFENIIKAEGYHPEWLSKIAEAEYYNMLLDERTAVKSALESLYVAGLISQEVLREKLKEIKFLDDEINYLIQRANYRLQEKLVDLYMDALRYALHYEKITLEEYAARLADLGLRDEIVQALVAIEKAKMRTPVQQTPEDQVRAMGYSVVVRRYKEGLITDVELEQELRMLGYDEPRIQQIKILARLERDYDYAMQVLSTVKSAYKRRKIGDGMFIEILRNFGFTDEKILLELNLLKLYMGYLGEEEVSGE